MDRAAIELIHGGCVLPLTFVMPSREGCPGRFDGSLHYGDGSICDLGTARMAGCQHVPASPPSLYPESLVHTAGHHVFGGLLNNVHFGHFITESLVRLWAFDLLGESFKSVVFYKYSVKSEVPNFVSEVAGQIRTAR